VSAPSPPVKLCSSARREPSRAAAVASAAAVSFIPSLEVPMSEVTRFRPVRRLVGALAALLVLGSAQPARAWLYDQNQNRIDDRIETVNASGLAAAYENGDLTKRTLIGVTPGPP